MAYNFASASSQRITLTGSNAGALDFAVNSPMAVSVWINATTFVSGSYIFCKGFDGGSSEAYELRLSSSTDLSFGCYNGAFHQATVAHGFSTGAWNHCYGEYSGTTWKVVANNGTPGTSVDAVGPRDNNETCAIGAQFQAGPTYANWFNGAIAELGVWNRALNAGEILALSKGIAPPVLRQGLVMYTPLVRDLVSPAGGGGWTLTVSGSPPTVVPHVRVLNVKRPRTKVRFALPPPPTTLFAQACL